ncbi:hypothetical protein D3C85_1711530 [compost metagenome]
MGTGRRCYYHRINSRVVQHRLQIAVGFNAQTFRQPLRRTRQRIGHRRQHRTRHAPCQRLRMESAHSASTDQTNTQGLG